MSKSNMLCCECGHEAYSKSEAPMYCPQCGIPVSMVIKAAHITWIERGLLKPDKRTQKPMTVYVNDTAHSCDVLRECHHWTKWILKANQAGLEGYKVTEIEPYGTIKLAIERPNSSNTDVLFTWKKQKEGRLDVFLGHGIEKLHVMTLSTDIIPHDEMTEEALVTFFHSLGLEMADLSFEGTADPMMDDTHPE